jgi:mRNA interferase MazF
MSEFPRRGDIYWVSLDPTVGSEIQKTRPGLILSNDLSNKYAQRVIIGPITNSVGKLYPFEAKVRILEGVSKIMLDQIRSVDKMRLGKKICSITVEEMHQVEKALKLTLSL